VYLYLADKCNKILTRYAFQFNTADVVPFHAVTVVAGLAPNELPLISRYYYATAVLANSLRTLLRAKPLVWCISVIPKNTRKMSDGPAVDIGTDDHLAHTIGNSFEKEV
jgi:hypothetical protein